MEQEKIQAFQQRLQELQKEIFEKDKSSDNRVTVSMNGKMEIAELKIDESLSTRELEIILPQLINSTIVKVSLKMQNAMKLASQI
jgi:DNA-binding protein YbaB